MSWAARAAHFHVLELCRADPPNHAAALPHLVRSARLGHRRSVYAMGNWYQYGIGGLPIDPERAVQYYRVAARGLDRFALNDLGMCYSEGMGVRPSPRLCLFYGILCAMQGDESGCATVRSGIDGTEAVRDLADFQRLWSRAQETRHWLKSNTDFYWDALGALDWPVTC